MVREAQVPGRAGVDVADRFEQIVGVRRAHRGGHQSGKRGVRPPPLDVPTAHQPRGQLVVVGLRPTRLRVAAQDP